MKILRKILDRNINEQACCIDLRNSHLFHRTRSKCTASIHQMLMALAQGFVDVAVISSIMYAVMLSSDQQTHVYSTVPQITGYPTTFEVVSVCTSLLVDILCQLDSFFALF